MSLYDEALEEFKKALASTPAFHADLFRYPRHVFIQLEKIDEMRGLWNQILADRTVTLGEKGGIVSDIVSALVRTGPCGSAHTLLSGVSDDQKRFIENYEQILNALSSVGNVSAIQALVEDVEAGKVHPEPPAVDSTDAPN